MAKRKDGIGHNSDPLTDDEMSALSAYYSTKIRLQQKKAAEKKAEYDSERAEVNAWFSKVKGDLRFSRKEFEEVLALQDMSDSEFRHHESKRTARLAVNGLPVGEQLELALGDTADDQAAAYSNGYRAGRRGDECPLENVNPVLHQNVLAGWQDAQAELIALLGKAETILEARALASDSLRESEGDEPDEPMDEETFDDVDLNKVFAEV